MGQVNTTTTWNFPTWPWAVFAGAVWAELRTLLLCRYSVSRLTGALNSLPSPAPFSLSFSLCLFTLWGYDHCGQSSYLKTFVLRCESKHSDNCKTELNTIKCEMGRYIIKPWLQVRDVLEECVPIWRSRQQLFMVWPQLGCRHLYSLDCGAGFIFISISS